MVKPIPKVQMLKEGVKIPSVVQHDAYIYYGGLFKAINSLRHEDGDAYNAGIINRGTQHGRRVEKAVRYLIYDLGPKNYRSISISDDLLDPSIFVPAQDSRTSEFEAGVSEPIEPCDTTIAIFTRADSKSGLVVVHRLVDSWDLVDGAHRPSEVQYLAAVQGHGSLTHPHN
jgi:hypothetical protein